MGSGAWSGWVARLGDSQAKPAAKPHQTPEELQAREARAWRMVLTICLLSAAEVGLAWVWNAGGSGGAAAAAN